MYELGGFYFDTDVRILKNLDDLRYQQVFAAGREPDMLILAEDGKHSSQCCCKKILEFRQDEPFALGNGCYNAEASGYYETAPLMELGLKIEDINQKLDGINVYASSFFPRIIISMGTILKMKTPIPFIILAEAGSKAEKS